MPRKVFISYSHQQGDWVFDRLYPLLEAGGAEVLIDRNRFRLGLALFDQMDALQDEAEVHLLCFSGDYLSSAACRHEMERAIGRDPDFKKGIVIPVKVSTVDLPDDIAKRNPLYADLQPGDAAAWELVLEACRADLGISPLQWLEARDEIRRLLGRDQGVNLVTSGKVRWNELVEHLSADPRLELPVVNLESGATITRHGLASTILDALGIASTIPPEPHDLGVFENLIQSGKSRRLALTHFHFAAHRQQAYDVDWFASLRFLVMDRRKLVLLVQSRRPYMSLLPPGHPLSEINLHHVELKGRP